LRVCQRRYGDRITFRFPRVGTYVYLADPADITSGFRGNPETYHAGEANGTVLASLLGSTSVLVTDDGQHRRQRRLMAPPFHGSAVRRQEDLMAEIAATEVETWPVGSSFPLLPRMRDITLEVILGAVIGTHDEARLRVLRQVLPPVVKIEGLNLLQFLYPRLGGYWPWRRFGQLKERADAALSHEIDLARSAPDVEQRSDVLAMLVCARDEDGTAMSDQELRDQLMTLLLAGHETTATSLAWTFERLVRHPDVLAQARRAALDSDDAYLDAIITESLRVRPVILDVARRLTTSVELGPYRLPAGTILAPSIFLVHTAEQFYPDSSAWDPSRWVGRRPDTTRWLPFGGGNRRCLGAAFAATEMRVVLREVLRRVELAPTGARAERPKVRHVTMVPDKGAVVTVRSRQPVVAGVPRS
ncbi:MAG: cytochrome P450, partial [Acidimicrobiales bacterium]